MNRHVRNKDRLRALKERAKDPDEPLELVIVRDMWLTGFDSPSLHTMYVDKVLTGLAAVPGAPPGTGTSVPTTYTGASPPTRLQVFSATTHKRAARCATTASVSGVGSSAQDMEQSR